LNLYRAKYFSHLRKWVRSGAVKTPEGVYRELAERTDQLYKVIQLWEKKYAFVVTLNTLALTHFQELQKKYGTPFVVGNITFKGFWAGKRGQRSADAQVVALAKSFSWVVISNDSAVTGACMLENIPCRHWQEFGRLISSSSRSVSPEQGHLL
jgi:hypothetical protein